MFSQTLVNLLNHDPEFYGALMSELDKTSRAVFKVILTSNISSYYSAVCVRACN